ncbi:MAG: class I SAM-dependent methyltransferase [Bacteroidota bacterium]|nr:class I SAM-dependent methyltransferase [Bacteroidota bacterium]
MKCKICENEIGNVPFEPEEMMFGNKEKFLYFQCSKCNCLQIMEVPHNLEEHYPKNYYSFKLLDEKKRKSLKNKLILWRLKSTIFSNGINSKIVRKFFPMERYEHFVNLNLNFNNKILDVGSGNGSFFLYNLAGIGFSNILGVDPFLQKNIEYKNGLRIIKKYFHEVEGFWDLIILHHSFEHMPDPKEIFSTIKKRLAAKGTCMIFIPTVSSYAWRHYGIYWCQLDAPRHLFLHSVESMNKLAELAGLKIDKIIYNSSAFQFEGSEKYRKGISLIDQIKNKYQENLITRKLRLWKYQNMARKLNRNKEGDQAVFYISR